VRGVAFHPEQPLAVSSSDDGMVKVWNLARVKRPNDLRSAILQDPVRTCYSHTGAALCVAAATGSNDGGNFFASGGADGIVRLWTVPTGRDAIAGRPSSKADRDSYLYGKQHRLAGHSDAVWSVAAAGNLVVSASADGTGQVWRLGNDSGDGDAHREEKHRSTKKKKRAKGMLPSAVLRKDGRGGGDSDVPTSVVLPGPLSSSSGLGRAVALFGYASGDVGHWDLTTGAIVASIGDETNVNTNGIALHGTMPLLFAARSDGSLRAYDLRANQVVHENTVHVSGASSVCVHPGGFFVATGGIDGDVRVWDVRSVSSLKPCCCCCCYFGVGVGGWGFWGFFLFFFIYFHPVCADHTVIFFQYSINIISLRFISP
jgi:WD40 repeat protein